MSNMSYCRHENTVRDLADVWEQWDDFDESRATEREVKARARLVRLVGEMCESLTDHDEVES